jgi:MFS family permease
VSQPLAGFLFSVGRVVPFAFDGITYGASLASLLFIRTEFQKERQRSVQRLRAEIAEGVRRLWNERFLRAATLLSAGPNFAHSAFPLVLIVRAKELGASPTLIGIMFALFAAGALVGSFIAPWVQRSVKPSVLVIGAIWLWAVTTALLVAVHSTVVLGVLAGVEALVGPSWNVIVGSYRYALVPDRLLGRVSSAGSLVSWGMIPLGSLAAGLLLQAYGTRTTFLVLTAIFVAVAIVASSARTIRDAPRLETVLADTR